MGADSSARIAQPVSPQERQSRGDDGTDTALFDFRVRFCNIINVETHVFGFRLPANIPRAKGEFLSPEAHQWQLKNRIT